MCIMPVVRRYAVVGVPDLKATNSFCYRKVWPPEDNKEVAGVRHRPQPIEETLERVYKFQLVLPWGTRHLTSPEIAGKG